MKRAGDLRTRCGGGRECAVESSVSELVHIGDLNGDVKPRSRYTD